MYGLVSEVNFGTVYSAWRFLKLYLNPKKQPLILLFSYGQVGFTV